MLLLWGKSEKLWGKNIFLPRPAQGWQAQSQPTFLRPPVAPRNVGDFAKDFFSHVKVSCIELARAGSASPQTIVIFHVPTRPS